MLAVLDLCDGLVFSLLASGRDREGSALVFFLPAVSCQRPHLLAERGLDVSRQTVADWAQKFGVLLAEAGRRHAKPLGRRWFVDETYLRVGTRWAYLYRAVDEAGQVVDVLLHERRDWQSVKAFSTRP